MSARTTGACVMAFLVGLFAMGVYEVGGLLALVAVAALISLVFSAVWAIAAVCNDEWWPF